MRIFDTGFSDLKIMSLRPVFAALLLLALAAFGPAPLMAGTFAPAAGEAGTTAVHKDSGDFSGWAASVISVSYGSNVDNQWRTPEKALGLASGTAFDIVCLGDSGNITLGFSPGIRNGPGWDFAVFENSFSDTFLELAFVEVSSDGANFLRFPARSLTDSPVGGYGRVDTTDVDGFAGKYRQGYGTPFDLSDLALYPKVLSGVVNLSAITFVRLIDVKGDGSSFDSEGRRIYDPYPQSSSAGFDLDALGARYLADSGAGINVAPLAPVLAAPLDGALGVALAPVLSCSRFSDPDLGDYHLMSTWQVSSVADFSTLVLERTSTAVLTSLAMPPLVLSGDSRYYFRVRHYDGAAHASDYSTAFGFTTLVDLGDSNGNGVPDAQETARDWDGDGLPDPGVTSVIGVSGTGAGVVLGIKPGDNVAALLAAASFDPRTLAGTPDGMESGAIGFRIKLIDPAMFATVVVHLSVPAPQGSTWSAHDPVSGWSAYPHAVFSADGKTVTLTLADGVTGYGDTDGTPNGIIADPGGAVHPAVVDVPDSEPAGIGGGGGCLIRTLFG